MTKQPFLHSALKMARLQNLLVCVVWCATRVEVYGTKGWARFEDTLGPHGAGRIETQRGPLAFEVGNPYQGEIEDFVAAIRENRPPEVDGEEGMRNVELMSRAVE